MSIFTQLRVVMRCGHTRDSRLYQLDPAVPLRGTPRLSEKLPGHTSFAITATGQDGGAWELALVACESWPEPLSVEIRFKSVVLLTHFTVPTFTGQLERLPFSAAPASFFHGEGSSPSTTLPEARLAMPAVIAGAGALRWLVGADPMHSASFAAVPGSNEIVISWRLLPEAGVQTCEVRRLFIQPVHSERQALHDWFDFATP
jgi:hypothetical protein